MISLRDVTVAYGSQVVLDGVDLDICDGETLAILGAQRFGEKYDPAADHRPAEADKGPHFCGWRRYYAV